MSVPVDEERKAFEVWAHTQTHCIGYPKCDGDLEGTEHINSCPMSLVPNSNGRSSTITSQTAYVAGWQTARADRSALLVRIEKLEELLRKFMTVADKDDETPKWNALVGKAEFLLGKKPDAAAPR